jgi:23S rRNA A1618 N6-methylase RlmF
MELMLTDLVDTEGRDAETHCAHPFHLTTLVAAATDRTHWRDVVKKIGLQIKKKEGRNLPKKGEWITLVDDGRRGYTKATLYTHAHTTSSSLIYQQTQPLPVE